VSVDVVTGGPAVADQPPPSVDQYVDVIRATTELMERQATDLLRSKRFRRLVSSQEGVSWRRLQRPERTRLAISLDDEVQGPAILHWLERIPLIVRPLETNFINAIIQAHADDPERFVALGLTNGDPAWEFKHAAFEVARLQAEEPAAIWKTAEGKIKEGFTKRDPEFRLADSLIGTGLAAIPVEGSLICEGYQEAKEGLEGLGAVAKSLGGAVARGAKAGGKKVAKVLHLGKKEKPTAQPMHAGE
jgi:hypothetical protein